MKCDEFCRKGVARIVTRNGARLTPQAHKELNMDFALVIIGLVSALVGVYIIKRTTPNH